MARTANKKPEASVIETQPETLDVALVQSDLQAHDTMNAQLKVIDAQFGGGEFEITSYNRERVLNECKFFLGQSAQAMLETGKRLILLKEHEPHGEFMRLVEEGLGMAPQVARRMMQAALKFLDPKRAALSVLGRAKIYELMVLDDEELDALAEGGTVAGYQQSDIERMTTRELHAALRDAKEEIDAKKASIALRDERINALEDKVNRKKKDPTTALPEETLLAELNEHALMLVREVEIGMRSLFVQLQNQFDEGLAPNHVELAMQQALAQSIQAARCLAGDFGITLKTEDQEPQELMWIKQSEEMFGPLDLPGSSPAIEKVN